MHAVLLGTEALRQHEQFLAGGVVHVKPAFDTLWVVVIALGEKESKPKITTFTPSQMER